MIGLIKQRAVCPKCRERIDGFKKVVEQCPKCGESFRLQIGESLCDMHYGQLYPFMLPKDIREQWEVVSEVTFQSPNFHDWINQHVNKLCEGSGRYHSYLNKMLVLIDYHRHSGDPIFAYHYDGNTAAIVRLKFKT